MGEAPIVVVRSLSQVRLFVTPCAVARQAFLPFTVSQTFPKLMSIDLMVLSIRLLLCRPLLLPSTFPSIRVFSNELPMSQQFCSRVYTQKEKETFLYTKTCIQTFIIHSNQKGETTQPSNS